MTKPNDKLVEFPRQSARDILTDVLRDGAQQMLATAIEAEGDDCLAGRASTVDAAGRRYVVRNGHLPPRAIQTPLGDVQVQQPRVRDRRPTDERETFRSAILPPYLRKTPSVEALYPWLYLKGISTGDFGEALQALLGPEARGLSATTITRLKAVWEQEYQDWSKRSLAHRSYAYVWADGVYFNVRLEDTVYCPRVLGQWFDGIRFYAAASSPTRSRRTWAGASIVVFLQHPLFVVCPLEREQGQAEFLDGREAPHPQQILLQRADEALRDAVAFGLPHEARGTLDTEERDLLLKIVGQVVRPVVVTQPQPTGHAVADAPEAFADALADRLQGLEAGPALGGMKDRCTRPCSGQRPRRQRLAPRRRSPWPSCPYPTLRRAPQW